MIESAIRYILINDATVKAITTRVYYDDIPQDPTYPLILITQISGHRDQVLRGPTGHAHPRYQVDAWTQKASGYGHKCDARRLAAAIRVALDGYSGTVGDETIRSCVLYSERPQTEPELKAYRIMQDYMIWHEE
jgi:hypothetical protein